VDSASPQAKKLNEKFKELKLKEKYLKHVNNYISLLQNKAITGEK
jgi:hypothetical protein